MRSFILIITILFIVCTAAFAQELRLAVKDESLDKVLGKLGVEVSYNGRVLSAYTVTVSKKFQSPQQAIEYLLKGKPFICEQIGGVYVISPKPDNKPSNQPLRLSAIKNEKATAQLPEIRNIHIGEVLITAHALEMVVEHGNTSEETYLNHKPASYMPGGRDNTVFTLLRMIPGVRASGEPSDELIVWGSTGGESMISFDGFTLFGMKNFNDNISSINPYMVQDIRLYKGGYDVTKGGRIGGIAEVSGITRRNTKPSFKANVSNLTANIFGSIPITKRSVLSAAYRQTFYDLYNSELLNPFGGRGSSMSNGKGNGITQNETELFITPRYGFKDVNVKYAGRAFDNDHYSVSLYGASDKFDFTILETDSTEQNALQKSDQYAGSAIYDKQWNSTTNTKITFSFSQLSTTEDHFVVSTGMMGQPSKLFTIDNSIRELSGRINHTFDLTARQRLDFGGEVMNYVDQQNEEENKFIRYSVYAMDQFTFNKLSVNGGLRMDVLADKVFLQPRLSATYKLNETWKASTSWGVYNQFIARDPYKVEGDHLVFVWKGIQEKPLWSMHTVAGLTYENNGLLINGEIYNKEIKDATRIKQDSIYTTDVSICGIDLFSKLNFGKATLFGGYSLVNTNELKTEWGHEVKLGTILSVSPFTISANYVYGTGFLNTYTLSQQMGMGMKSMGSGMGGPNKPGGGGSGGGGMKPGEETVVSADKPYSRLDVGATYSLRLRDWTLQTGVSLINVFDTSNIKYSNAVSDKNNPVTLYTKAMPFTPMFFLEVLF